MVIKSKEINDVGVKQGAATSGTLFIIYIDRMIKLIKHNCEPIDSRTIFMCYYLWMMRCCLQLQETCS